jgi:hypothetical protein
LRRHDSSALDHWHLSISWPTDPELFFLSVPFLFAIDECTGSERILQSFEQVLED